jgi:hypothetical protein
MQKGVILGCGNRSNARMDTITLGGKQFWPWVGIGDQCGHGCFWVCPCFQEGQALLVASA